MKIRSVLSIAITALFLSACSETGNNVQRPANPAIPIVEPATISGTLFTQRALILPSDATLTVTLASVTDIPGPTQVLAQTVKKLEGEQAPIHYQLPLKGVKITPESQALLTATVSLNDKVIMTAKSLQPVVTGSSHKQDLTLISVPNVALAVAK